MSNRIFLILALAVLVAFALGYFLHKPDDRFAMPGSFMPADPLIQHSTP